LQDRSRYYATGIAAALRCDDFDGVLQSADLSKAGGSLRASALLPRRRAR
jgi:hypothetical protein